MTGSSTERAPEILYEDNHLVAVNKRPSEIVQGDKTGDAPLGEEVKKYLKAKYHKPGDVFLGIAHRLDRPVSGVLIFARTSKALERLNRMFAGKEIKKTYWAVVGVRPPADSGRLVHYLTRNQEKNISKAHDSEVKGSRKAELMYRLAGKSDRYYFLEINPLTGRHHQIRCQLSAIGCPIKGDIKYGFPRTNSNASIHLHSRKAEFVHPVSGKEVQILASPPNDPLWKKFAEIEPDKKQRWQP